jgi:hypothetical protein
VAGHEGQITHVAEPVIREITVGSPITNRGILPPQQALFQARLARLLHQEEEWRPRVASDDWRIRLIHHAIYSTYCDCVAMGLGDRARDLVRRNQTTV